MVLSKKPMFQNREHYTDFLFDCQVVFVNAKDNNESDQNIRKTVSSLSGNQQSDTNYFPDLLIIWFPSH